MAKKAKKAKPIEEIVAVQAGPTAFAAVLNIHHTNAPLQVSGQVIRTDWDRKKGKSVCILNTNDSLYAIWRSPTDHYWCGSAAGMIYTTAKVPFTTPNTDDDLDVAMPVKALRWTYAPLPPMKKQKYAPNVSCLWGSSDRDVWAGLAVEGGFFHWNGKNWNQHAETLEDGIEQIHGDGPNNFYAVTNGGELLHFAGRQWKKVTGTKNDQVTSVWTLPDGVIACTNEGAVFRGKGSRVAEVAKTSAGLSGITLFCGRILVASTKGLMELKNGKLMIIRDTFIPVSVHAAGKKLLMLDEQEAGPEVIEHDPDLDPPYYGHKFGS
jgi:hypothetical protein